MSTPTPTSSSGSPFGALSTSVAASIAGASLPDGATPDGDFSTGSFSDLTPVGSVQFVTEVAAISYAQYNISAIQGVGISKAIDSPSPRRHQAPDPSMTQATTATYQYQVQSFSIESGTRGKTCYIGWQLDDNLSGNVPITAVDSLCHHQHRQGRASAGHPGDPDPAFARGGGDPGFETGSLTNWGVTGARNVHSSTHAAKMTVNAGYANAAILGQSFNAAGAATRSADHSATPSIDTEQGHISLVED
ncbi:hypothetical protein K437DRAFT_266359 [Tilletiaria anomala UBC 951]|uniref:Uncharacterized protein n=1 Tax=Tilletiaria anomala (strain ATCC 24038 / CBS 436.72 / UBC 951) TaxID=1037660 RepID=A0A066WFW2_TILAU|nr:uncharacterized protein K437DRAFT_266359 [Tilletiaria anomala UBC 951]KDN52691.1 hypothetical protein K437DRAFT_266359 [Tilletiaria anomala UBC 951]